MKAHVLNKYQQPGSIFRLVEMIVDFCLRIRSFKHRNNCDVVNEFESSVPRSSMMSRSQSKIFWCVAMASASFSNTPLLNISNNWNAVK